MEPSFRRHDTIKLKGEAEPDMFDYLAGGAQVVAGAATIAGTIAEDVATGGVGIADDPLTIAAGGSAIARGLEMIGVG